MILSEKRAWQAKISCGGYVALYRDFSYINTEYTRLRTWHALTDVNLEWFEARPR